MRAVIQRVRKATVTVGGDLMAAIDRGFVVLIGVTHDDTREQAQWLAKKISGLRLFEDETGLTNLSLDDVGGQMLVVSQFTLYADARKGRRPSFTRAAAPETAEPLIAYFIEQCKLTGLPVETGVFRAHMQVLLVNDGPVTLILER